MGVEPHVAAFALFATDLWSIQSAMDFIYSKRYDLASGRFKFEHKFIGCLPDRPEYMTLHQEVKIDQNETEHANIFNSIASDEICYVCQKGRDYHVGEYYELNDFDS